METVNTRKAPHFRRHKMERATTLDVEAAWCGMEATETLPLRLSHGAVTTASGALVLDALPATSVATDDAAAASHGGLLLGFRGTGVPASLLDLPLGLVSAASITPCTIL